MGLVVSSANVAVTSRFVFIVTSHGPRPEQSPDQPANVDPPAGVPAAGVAVKVTVCWSPSGNDSVQ